MTAWDRRSGKEQARVEELALADWLPGAVSFAPHWSAVATRTGLDPDELVTHGDLLRIPPSLQGDVAARGATELVQRPTEDQVKAMASSSLIADIARAIGRDQVDGKRRVLLEQFKPVHVTRGGAADQLAIASSRADIDRLHRAGARAAAVLGLGDHDYLVSAIPAGPSWDWWSVHALALGSSMLGLHPRGHGQGLNRCIEAFSLLPATAVACHPAEAVDWARALAEADADVSRVVDVVLVGPPPDEDFRAEVAEAWRTAGALEGELVVRSLWSPDVHRGIWVECREGTEGLHTLPDMEVLEVIEPLSGRLATQGGDLALTTLSWSGTTLLRYRTGTRIDGLTEPGEACPACGRTVPRIRGPVRPGVWQPLLDRGDEGVAVLDLRAAALELDDTPVVAWRVAVHGDGPTDGYRVEVGGTEARAQLDRIADRLERATGLAPSEVVVADSVDELKRRTERLGSPFTDTR